MLRQRFIILHKGLPQRCEICHKQDCFDPLKGVCQRCERFSVELINTKQSNCSRHPDDVNGLQVLGALLIFAVNCYFWPNASIWRVDSLMANILYYLFVAIGVILVCYGKQVVSLAPHWYQIRQARYLRQTRR